MFFDVKVLNPQGQIKEIISGQELSRLHWKAFRLQEAKNGLTAAKKSKISSWEKRKLDLEFTEIG